MLFQKSVPKYSHILLKSIIPKAGFLVSDIWKN